MKQVLVTGAAGVLGRALLPQLAQAGYGVRAMSRRAPLPEPAPPIAWVHADLETGDGLAESVRGADVIIHGASNPIRARQTDVEGTQRLSKAAASVSHFVYVSIVGIDKIPLPYYRAKLAAEALVQGSGVPWSILRVTQFHTLVDMLLSAVSRLPLALLPAGFQGQPIEPAEAATRLVESVGAGPGGRLPDIGGPEILALNGMARTWLAARGRRRLLVTVPVPGRLGAGFRQGFNTVPDGRYGRVTWADWVSRRYPRL